MNVVFWVSAGLILYTYGGYVLLITLLSFLRPRRILRRPFEPNVTVIIAAYNEEKDLERKLRNTLELDYPREKMEIIVASDGSTDRTDEIARRWAHHPDGVKVVLHRVEGRRGKTAAQNSAVRVASGEILVFSDAASLYEKGALRALARNYGDPTVGAVSGRYRYLQPRTGSVGKATILFWAFENYIKSRQTRLGTLTGCCGCIYSVRRALYTELPAEIISDLVEPLTVLRQGYRIVFEPEALAWEEPVERPKDEFMMRIRVIVRGMNGLLYMRELLNPLRYPLPSFQLISHKVIRWLVPVLCLTALASSGFLALKSPIYRLLFTTQVLFYLMALTGLVLERGGIRSRLLSLPMYFTIVNAASLVSLIKLFRGENIVVWQTQRRERR